MAKYNADMNISELRNAAKENGINSYGRGKEELVRLLNEAEEKKAQNQVQEGLQATQSDMTTMQEGQPAALPEIEPENADVEKTGEVIGQKLYTEDEVKAQIAEALRKATEAAEAKVEPKEDKLPDEAAALIEELRAQNRLLQQQLANQTSPQIVQVMADTKKITLLYMCECADDNVINFGPGGVYGRITGKLGTLVVPESEWSKFYTDGVRKMLEKRILIVVDGMDDEQRELYGVNYSEGEYLDKMAFTKMLDFGRKLLDIFPKLCKSHKEMIAKRFYTAFQEGDPRVMDRDLIVALNKQTEDDLFLPIIDGLNAYEAKKRGKK